MLASAGLTAIWSNTVGFPRTQFLAWGGARDGTRFKAIARDKQVYTDAWYSAYPELTVASARAETHVRISASTTLSPTLDAASASSGAASD